MISGTAEANASVQVSDGTVPLGMVTATGGRWVLAGGGISLTQATHRFRARATDQAGNTGPASAAIVYTVDTTAPVITLTGANPMTVAQGSVFADPGSAVMDNVDVGLIATVSGAVNTGVVGTYILSYNVSDAAGNAATAVSKDSQCSRSRRRGWVGYGSSKWCDIKWRDW